MRMLSTMFLFFCLSAPLLAHGEVVRVEVTGDPLSSDRVTIEGPKETVAKILDMISPSEEAPACDEDALAFPEASRSMIIQVAGEELKNVCLNEGQAYHVIFANEGSYDFTVLPGGVQITLTEGQYIIERR